MKITSALLFRPFEKLADRTPTSRRLLPADIALAAAVSVFAALTAAWCASRMGQTYLVDAAIDIWFDSDAPRVFSNLISPQSNHYRTSVHPISALMLTPPAWALHKLVGLSQVVAAQIVTVGAAACTAGVYVLTLRLMGIGVVATACLSVLLVTSAAFLFWGGTVELYTSGGFTIIVTFAALAAGSRLGVNSWIAVSALSLSITVTNWMSGVAASLVRWRRMAFIRVTATALLAVMALSLIQKGTFNRAALFFDLRGLVSERQWTQPAMESRDTEGIRWSLLDNWRSVLLSTVVAPPPYLDITPSGDVARVSNQKIRWSKVSVVTVAATIGWALLLGLGIWGAVRNGPHRSLAVAVGLTLAGQAVLHGVYGYPTFLYAAHFLPILLTLAAFAWFTPLRRMLAALSLVVAGLAAAANIPSFLEANALMRQGLGARQERLALLDHVAQRSADPWPRGTGHVPLGRPGDRDFDKGWIEPGGSFSPSYDSFGISLWAIGADGAPVVTSDSLPLAQTTARYLDPTGAEPSVESVTPFWRVVWRVADGAGYDLELENRALNQKRIDIVIRSVGPAGGRLDRVDIQGSTLRLPSGWTLEPTEGALTVRLGVESEPNWKRAEPGKATDKSVEASDGWAYARIAGPAAGESVRFRLRRVNQLADLRVPLSTGPQLAGVDPKFVQALEAQIATLRIGISDRQTRPGDPINYPLQWLRDGAYIVVALARSGQVALARELSLAAASPDFFGGFGAEADAPGLAIWMLAEVAGLSRSTAFDEEIWPHIKRKVQLIEAMLDSVGDVRRPYAGPIVPAYARHADLDHIAGPARNGLINGKMDWHRPIFFINAVSHTGLLGAAEIAERLGHLSEATAWRTRATALAAAWNRALVDPAWAVQAANERTAIAGLWLGEIADPVAYGQLLDRRWPALLASFDNPQGPLWTYFTLAEAHQHLRLGRPDRARRIMDLFATRQPAPGLYTFWEGSGEENNFGLWARTRGWMRPPHVTPHYWAAAEMLLLQLSMLAYREGDTVVVGAGIAPDQLGSELSVAGVGIAGAFVDWSWSAGRLIVTVHDATRDLKVRPGPAFPVGAPVEIRHQLTERRVR